VALAESEPELPLAVPEPTRPTPLPRQAADSRPPGFQFEPLPPDVHSCAVPVRLDSDAVAFSRRRHFRPWPVMPPNRPDSQPPGVQAVPPRAGRPFVLVSSPPPRSELAYRKMPAATVLEPPLLQASPALFCGALSARASISACLLCNTGKAPPAMCAKVRVRPGLNRSRGDSRLGSPAERSSAAWVRRVPSPADTSNLGASVLPSCRFRCAGVPRSSWSVLRDIRARIWDVHEFTRARLRNHL